MPLFICQQCGCIENTACGFYWGRALNLFGPELQGKALCSECAPDHYVDGSPNPRGGKWHGRFPKEFATLAVVERIGRSNFYDLPAEFALPEAPQVKVRAGRQRSQPRRKR